MGAWGTRNFQNDDALDWVSEMEESDDGSILEATLNIVIQHGDEYLESPEACMALAAAEVVAAIKGFSSSDLPDEVANWISQHQFGSLSLAQLALRVVQRIKTNSELKELWDESDSAAEWHEVISDLETRLNR